MDTLKKNDKKIAEATYIKLLKMLGDNEKRCFSIEGKIYELIGVSSTKEICGVENKGIYNEFIGKILLEDLRKPLFSLKIEIEECIAEMSKCMVSSDTDEDYKIDLNYLFTQKEVFLLEDLINKKPEKLRCIEQLWAKFIERRYECLESSGDALSQAIELVKELDPMGLTSQGTKASLETVNQLIKAYRKKKNFGERNTREEEYCLSANLNIEKIEEITSLSQVEEKPLNQEDREVLTSGVNNSEKDSIMSILEGVKYEIDCLKNSLEFFRRNGKEQYDTNDTCERKIQQKLFKKEIKSQIDNCEKIIKGVELNGKITLSEAMELIERTSNAEHFSNSLD